MISLSKYPFKQQGLYKDRRTEHPRLVGHKNINSVLLKDFCTSVFSAQKIPRAAKCHSGN